MLKMMLRSGFFVVALILAACEKPQEQAAGVAPEPARSSAEQKAAEAAATGARPAGPHGAYDPHAALDAERMIKVALQHRAEGRVSLAMQSIDEAAGRFPQDAEVLSVRGSLYLEQDRVTQALEDFEASLRLRPDDARTLVNRWRWLAQ